MSETRIIVDKLRVTYEGLFSVKDLYGLIDMWLQEKGYDKFERRNVEKVTEKGKMIELHLAPWKKITDYAKIMINVRFIATDVTEVEIERDGTKIKTNQGKIQLVFDGWLQTDYEGRWEKNALWFFLRFVFDKYVYRPYTSSYESQVAKDVGDLHGECKAFLNLYRYKH